MRNRKYCNEVLEEGVIRKWETDHETKDGTFVEILEERIEMGFP